MPRENLKQRIQYLIEHGGTFPENPPDRLRWVILGLLAFIALANVLQLLKLLR